MSEHFVQQSFDILSNISPNGLDELKQIERAGRICYMSNDKITEDGESAIKFVGNCIKKQHMTPLEHVNITVKFVTDRGVTHELVRHRLAAFNQESTRYCDYTSSKFNNAITFIEPCDLMCWSFEQRESFYNACEAATTFYKQMINAGCSPEQARSILPTCTKAEIIVTANLREWRHIFELRCTKYAHPQIRELMCNLLNEFKNRIPVVFDDLVFTE